jgi:hypothetical protein
MARRNSNAGVVVLAGLALGALVWYLFTRKPLVTSTVGSSSSSPAASPLPPLCTNIPIPDVTLPNGVVIPGEPNLVCTAGG